MEYMTLLWFSKCYRCLFCTTESFEEHGGDLSVAVPLTEEVFLLSNFYEPHYVNERVIYKDQSKQNP